MTAGVPYTSQQQEGNFNNSSDIQQLKCNAYININMYVCLYKENVCQIGI